MSDRRIFPRIPGSALPWIRLSTTRSPVVEVLDISEGGALIETPTLVKPGEREIVLLTGKTTIRVVGCAERVNITRLVPSVSYRMAIRFITPIPLSTVAGDSGLAASSLSESAPTESRLLTGASLGLVETFASSVRALSGVHAVRVGASLTTYPGTEPVHFAVPTSCHGEGRVLQVFFAPGTMPTPRQFVRLRELAVLASGLPDLDITPSD